MIRSLLAASTLAGLFFSQAAGDELTEQAWRENQDIYQAILRHPFLKEMQNGSLPTQTFAFYLLQDAFYLGEFGRALEATASKAPKAEWRKLLMQHARESVQAEMELHRSILDDYGVSMEQRAEKMEPAPEAFAYTSFLVATACSRSFEESIAALLPCYWIYWEVGKELAATGSTDPHYQKWIDNYSSQDYADTVKAVMAIVNEVARGAQADTVQKMKEHFRRSSRYEWMFWDSAYARRRWPPP